ISTVFAMFHFPANSNASSNMFIAEAKSWRQAQSHCRSLSSDLVSIHSAEENAADSLLSRSQTVWIGLFGDPWKWSSGSNSSFRLWKPNQPNYVNSQQCVVTELKDGGKWNNRNCNFCFFFLKEKLILIKKNLTWIEALTYCQKHHVDLVLIDSKDTQDKVAAKVKNATSQYVWLGLCYSCTFKFWFWIGTTPSCYQNWMPGQGPEMVYECGTRGAVEATGRHWNLKKKKFF
uniref:Si:ch211-282j17.11 n=1 Tax=Oryzias sinensis TaxID=183150 RepID=A0A8C7ZMT9_9TELE